MNTYQIVIYDTETNRWAGYATVRAEDGKLCGDFECTAELGERNDEIYSEICDAIDGLDAPEGSDVIEGECEADGYRWTVRAT